MKNQITNSQALRLVEAIQTAIDIGKKGTDAPLTAMGLSAEFAMILDLEVIQPRYKHVCDKCVFVGFHGDLDLWVHPTGESHPTDGSSAGSLIGREDGIPNAYYSIPASTVNEKVFFSPWIHECRRRALLRGLI